MLKGGSNYQSGSISSRCSTVRCAVNYQCAYLTDTYNTVDESQTQCSCSSVFNLDISCIVSVTAGIVVLDMTTTFASTRPS